MYLCKNTDSPTARLVGKGISRIGKPLEDIDKAIENSGKLEIYQLGFIWVVQGIFR